MCCLLLFVRLLGEDASVGDGIDSALKLVSDIDRVLGMLMSGEALTELDVVNEYVGSSMDMLWFEWPQLSQVQIRDSFSNSTSYTAVLISMQSLWNHWSQASHWTARSPQLQGLSQIWHKKTCDEFILCSGPGFVSMLPLSRSFVLRVHSDVRFVFTIILWRLKVVSVSLLAAMMLPIRSPSLLMNEQSLLAAMMLPIGKPFVSMVLFFRCTGSLVVP